MTYNFDEPVNRRNTASMKWNVEANELPMWVADMDFKTAPEVIAAIKSRVEHGVFGYSEVPDEWYDAYISWWQRRHGFTMEKEWLMFCTGVVPAISSCVRKLTTPNENVVIQTPVYNVFFNSILNNGCRALESPLIYDNGCYNMDYEDLENKLADPQTSLMILCNPQNPGGRIWTAEELSRVGDICAKYGVTVIADEIHCDLTAPGADYVPFASVSDTCKRISINCIAASKAFNLAGMQSAAISVADPFLRHKVFRAINTDEVAEPNALAVVSTIAAFNEGERWLDELNEYIESNKKLLEEYISNNIPAIKVMKSEATYLVWMDISGLEEAVKAKADYSADRKLSEYVATSIRNSTGLFITDGSYYGKAGEQFLRMNIACPKSTLEEGLKRLKSGIDNLL